jgi:hypothetical protein
MDIYCIDDLLRRRLGQPSFHMASESHLRIEFRNMKAGERLALPPFPGNVVLTCFRGSFFIHSDGPPVAFRPIDQCVTPVDVPIELACSEDGTIEFIWAPPFGKSQP